MSTAELVVVQASSSRASSFAVSTPPNRAQLNQQVQAVLGVAPATAAEIVQVFDDVVAKPLQLNLSKKKGRELAKRNPMIYTVRGTTTVDGAVYVGIGFVVANTTRRRTLIMTDDMTLAAAALDAPTATGTSVGLALLSRPLISMRARASFFLSSILVSLLEPERPSKAGR